MFIRESKDHLQENRMGYWEHFRFASGHGWGCIKAGCLLIIHSIIPAFFPRTGSILVNELNKNFTEHNEYLLLKNRVETFKKIVYHYRSKEKDQDFNRDCR